MLAKLVRAATLIAALAVPIAFASDDAYSSQCDNEWARPIGCNDLRLFPRAADVSQARLVTFPGVPRWAPAIYVAPAAKRGMCFVSIAKPYELTSDWQIAANQDEALLNVFWGCERGAGASWGWTLGPGIFPYPFYGPPNRTRVGMWLVSSVETAVAKVKLVFQDGVTVTVRPRARVIAYVLPDGRWRPGHRLVRALVYDKQGQELRRVHWNPKLHGTLPKPGS